MVREKQRAVIIQQRGEVRPPLNALLKCHGALKILREQERADGLAADRHLNARDAGKIGAQRIAQGRHALGARKAVGFQHIVQVMGKMERDDLPAACLRIGKRWRGG